MNFPRKIILLTAVTLAISLGTACSFFDADARGEPPKRPNQRRQARQSTVRCRPRTEQQTMRQPRNPTQGKQTLQEDQRWCQAWALDNLEAARICGVRQT